MSRIYLCRKCFLYNQILFVPIEYFFGPSKNLKCFIKLLANVSGQKKQ